jgi:hypothetical protein
LGSAGFGSAGFDGYTPGSLCGTDGGAADGVLQPLNAAGVAAASQQQQQGLVLTGGMLEDDGVHHEAELFHEEFQVEDDREQFDKENTPRPGSAGKGAVSMAAAAAAAGVFGSSLVSTQEGMLPWPAGAETLQEQEEEGEGLSAVAGVEGCASLGTVCFVGVGSVARGACHGDVRVMLLCCVAVSTSEDCYLQHSCAASSSTTCRMPVQLRRILAMRSQVATF